MNTDSLIEKITAAIPDIENGHAVVCAYADGMESAIAIIRQYEADCRGEIREDDEKIYGIVCKVAWEYCDNQPLAMTDEVMKAIRPYLATREPVKKVCPLCALPDCNNFHELKAPMPVSVSLEKCAEALHGQIIGAGEFNDWWHGEKKDFGREFLGNMVKAVLDAAGVKYVD